MFKECAIFWAKYIAAPLLFFGGVPVLIMWLFYPELIYVNNDLGYLIACISTIVGLLVSICMMVHFAYMETR